MNNAALWDTCEFRETPRALSTPQPTFRGPGVATDFAGLFEVPWVVSELSLGFSSDLLESVVALQRTVKQSKVARGKAGTLTKEAAPAVVQPLLEETAEPLHFFAPPGVAVQAFLGAFNGKGLKRLSRRMLGAHITAAEAADLLSDIVEDALIATFQHFMREGEESAVLQLQDEKVLLNAIAIRIPRLAVGAKWSIASGLLEQLKADLAFGRRLVVDGGTVSMLDGRIRAQLAKDARLPTSERGSREVRMPAGGHHDKRQAEAA